MTRAVAFLLVLALVVGGASVAAIAIVGHGDDGSSASAPSPEPGSSEAPSADLAPFYGQQLSWESCRDGDQCATLTVPLDYRHPDGETIDLAVLKVPASGDRIGSLVVNPGGPGAPGTDYAASADAVFREPLRRAYDIVGFDPRGTGGSDPVDCLSDDDLDAYVAEDPDPDTPAEVDDYLGWADAIGAGCVDLSGDLAAHVSTVEAARDMDVLRSALGESALDYFGASYGTKLGATYADLFPDRVGRFVLDGALDPEISARELSLGQAKGFETELREYVGDCVEQGGCFLGDSVDAGIGRIQDFLADVEDQPLDTDSGRQLAIGNAVYGIVLPLYSRDSWTYLTQALKQAFDGDGTTLLAFSDIYAGRGDSGYTDNSLEANYAINCLDDPTSYTPDEIEAELPAFEQAAPTFGPVLAWSLASCSGVQVTATEKAPKVEAKGAAPIVVIGTTRDPATPYDWAVSLAKELDSGVLVSRDGDGHTGYNSGNSCVDDAVESYLVDGTVPQDGLSC
ncbi:alpha/beta hydrolase [Nocardioides mangrovi]|uniref:Alpha/beta hydrolase n=1 Tax=Nocardioides mangrovi TaxID=2874580 RepID=A0ABS7UEP0_9ACTN|nr:alpha/beta hydrolase [Nocardioides mangrovi]MBZ5739123.1 alpha/beta hydrolase [Nocardioides mangrovi]